MKKALITGVTGQDGSYLAELLLEKGYEVHGVMRRTAMYPDSLENIEHIKDRVVLHMGDLATEHHVCSIIHELQPDEIYNLAAQSDVRMSFDIPEYTGDITGLGVTRLLEAVRLFSPQSKLYQASSSEMFGNVPAPQNEGSYMLPRSPYAAAKLYAHNLCRIYREGYGMFVACGILFNHESERRGKNFVTRKITVAAGKIAKGEQEYLYLGNLAAGRDWGYAPDYVEAMWLMLQHEKPEDFVIGTGITYTVEDFVNAAFLYYELNWRDYVKIDPRFYRPVEVNSLKADASKAFHCLDWLPKTSFLDMVRKMIEADK